MELILLSFIVNPINCMVFKILHSIFTPIIPLTLEQLLMVEVVVVVVISILQASRAPHTQGSWDGTQHPTQPVSLFHTQRIWVYTVSCVVNPTDEETEQRG